LVAGTGFEPVTFRLWAASRLDWHTHLFQWLSQQAFDRSNLFVVIDRVPTGAIGARSAQNSIHGLTKRWPAPSKDHKQ